MTITIIRAVQTCPSHPAQWDAWTTDGQYLYLRYRWGRGTVDDYPDEHHEQWTRVADGRIAAFQDDDPYAGEITLEEFCTRAGTTLAEGADLR